MARNLVFLLPHNFKPKKSIAVEFTFLIIAMYLREFLWNTVNEFLCFQLLSFTVKTSLISSDSQQWLEIVFVAQLQTLLKIPHQKNNFGEPGAPGRA